MRNSVHISEENSRAIRAAIAERLRFIIELARRQRVPPYLRQSIDRLGEEDARREAESSAPAKLETHALQISH